MHVFFIIYTVYSTSIIKASQQKKCSRPLEKKQINVLLAGETDLGPITVRQGWNAGVSIHDDSSVILIEGLVQYGISRQRGDPPSFESAKCDRAYFIHFNWKNKMFDLGGYREARADIVSHEYLGYHRRFFLSNRHANSLLTLGLVNLFDNQGSRNWSNPLYNQLALHHLPSSLETTTDLLDTATLLNSPNKSQPIEIDWFRMGPAGTGRGYDPWIGSMLLQSENRWHLAILSMDLNNDYSGSSTPAFKITLLRETPGHDPSHYQIRQTVPLDRAYDLYGSLSSLRLNNQGNEILRIPSGPIWNSLESIGARLVRLPFQDNSLDNPSPSNSQRMRLLNEEGSLFWSDSPVDDRGSSLQLRFAEVVADHQQMVVEIKGLNETNSSQLAVFQRKTPLDFQQQFSVPLDIKLLLAPVISNQNPITGNRRILLWGKRRGKTVSQVLELSRDHIQFLGEREFERDELPEILGTKFFDKSTNQIISVHRTESNGARVVIWEIE